MIRQRSSSNAHASDQPAWDYDPLDPSARLLPSSDGDIWQRTPATPYPWRFKRRSVWLVIGAISVATILCALLAIEIFQNISRPSERQNHRAGCDLFPEDCEGTASFIFDSIYSLLKQWPSTYSPNGHSIVTATVPVGTQLYHAKTWNGSPKKPTFFAFDPAMSIGIYGSVGSAVLHTMVPKKPLRVLFFDGQSASLTTTGSLDSQMAVLGLRVPKSPNYDYVYNETRRAHQLCDLSRELKIDGVARMNAGFEVMLCDYTASGVVESFISNITIPNAPKDRSLPHDPNRPPPLGYGNMYALQNSWEWVRSGTWHYGKHGGAGGSPMEKRIKIDLCRMVTFYDPRLRSLSGSHHGKTFGTKTYQNGWGLRKGHRLLDLSKADAQTVRFWLEQATTSDPEAQCSGIDWQALTEVVMDHYGSRIREIHAALERKTTKAEASQEIVIKVHELSHAMLYPYFEYPSVVDRPTGAIKERTISRCASAYTEHIETGSLGYFELILKESIHIVVSRLCGVVWELFELSGNRLGDFRTFEGNRGLIAAKTEAKTSLSTEIDVYQQKTASIMTWIGWDRWYDCDRKCEWNELCYIPMWPVIYAPGQHQGGIYGGSELSEEDMKRFWTPKCLSRSDFDKGGGRAREPKYRFPDIPYDNDSR